MPILREFWEWVCPYHCDTGTIPTELTGTRLPNGVPGFVFPSSAHRSTAFVLTCTNSLLKKRKGNRGRTGQLLAIFSLFLITVPEVFAKINSAQSPRFSSGDSSDMIVFLDKDEKPVGPI